MPKFKLRRLIWDIEVAPNVCLSWQASRKQWIPYENIILERAIICICWKWEDQKTVHHLTWDDGDDKEMVGKFLEVVEKADEMVAHNGDCVSADTPVLTADLRWVQAGDLKSGDKLVGFDEHKAEGTPRKLRSSSVFSNRIDSRPGYRVTFDNGDSVVTTANHPWLKVAAKGQDYRWCHTQNLTPGQRVRKFMEPWEDEISYPAGWLSGFIAGEGTLKRPKKGFAPHSIDFCQRPGKTYEQAKEYAAILGYDFNHDNPKTGSIGKGDTLYSYMRGGKWKVFEFLGKLQISRLIDNINWDEAGNLCGGNATFNTIVAVEPVGEVDMAILTTSTQTYFADGYPMHNSFDLKWFATRCLFHGFTPPPPIKTVDTLVIARRRFKLNSNRLDYIGKLLFDEGKIRTEFDLWKDILLNNCKKALRKMVRYCKQDVVLLERVWKRLQPFHQPKTHVGVLNGQEKWVCPDTGSAHVHVHSHKVTPHGTVQHTMFSVEAERYYTISDTAYKQFLSYKEDIKARNDARHGYPDGRNRAGEKKDYLTRKKKGQLKRRAPRKVE